MQLSELSLQKIGFYATVIAKRNSNLHYLPITISEQLKTDYDYPDLEFRFELRLVTKFIDVRGW